MKQKKILFIIISFIALILNNAFLHKHYGGDTMLLIDSGYLSYAKNFFFIDARFLSALQCVIANFLNLSINKYIFISDFLAIEILSFAVVLLSDFIIKYLNVQNKVTKFLVILSSYIIIFNNMTLEMFVFAEAGVMCLGILLSVIAVIIYLKREKNCLIYSSCILLGAVICYQGTISLYPVLIIALKCLKNNKDKKSVIIDSIKVGGIFCVIFIMYLFMRYVIQQSFGIEKNANEITFNFSECILSIKYLLILIFNKQMYTFPEYSFITILLISIIILLFFSKNKIKNIIGYLSILIIAYVICIVPIVVYSIIISNGILSLRLLIAIGAMLGILLLFLSIQINCDKINIKNFIISGMVIICSLFCIVNNYINSNQHLQSFYEDEKCGYRINELLTEYENNSGNKVTKFAYYLSNNSHNYYKNMRKLGTLTERKLYIWWANRQTVEYYCNRKFEKTDFSDNIYNQYFKNKKYDKFEDEQVIFENDTMYLYIF